MVILRLFLPVALCQLSQARLAAPRAENSSSLEPTEDSPLSVASCSQRLFELLGNPSYDGFTACVDAKLNTSNFTWFGPSAAAYAQCWCAWNMSDFVSAEGCSDDDNWNWLMQVRCGANCSDPVATQCKTSCPAFCFEGGPGLPGCACRDECLPVLGCMALAKEEDPDDPEHVDPVPVNSTEEAPSSCSVQTLRRSEEMKNFLSCAAANVTYGNRWRSLSQTFQCVCASHLQQELQSKECCDSFDAGTIGQSYCDAQCSLNCSSPEALECTEDCSSLCEGSRASEACTEKCLRSSGACHKYKVCPAPAPEFQYVCDDGAAPGSNGCCTGVFDNARCPLLCKEQWKTVSIWNPSQGRCECTGCPKTKEESRKLMNETLLADMERVATKQLVFILVSYRLQEITSEMRQLFAMQMEAIQLELERYDGKGLLDWELVHKLKLISSYYFQKLQQAAEAEVLALRAVQTAGAGMIWFALISCVCVISTIVVGCIISKSLALGRTRTQVVTEAPRTETLVVGRPINSKEPPPDAVQGVLAIDASTSR